MSIKIFVSEVSFESNFQTTHLLEYVSKDKKEKLLKYKFDIDRKLSLYSELMVRYQIWNEHGIHNQQIVFSKNDNEKPFLRGYPNFHFNISHTRNAIAVGFSNNKVGIDIERIKTPDLKIAKRFFTASEKDYLFSCKNHEVAFCEIWTKKEAYIKYIGTGLSTQLDSFCVLDNPISVTIYTFQTGEYIISACCKELEDSKPIIINITESEMHTLFKSIDNH